jgi:hypothetical protein
VKAVPQVQGQKGIWAWYTLRTGPGLHRLSFALAREGGVTSWKGKATCYFICDRSLPEETLQFELKSPAVERPMPPRPTPPGTFRANTKLAATELSTE